MNNGAVVALVIQRMALHGSPVPMLQLDPSEAVQAPSAVEVKRLDLQSVRLAIQAAQM